MRAIDADDLKEEIEYYIAEAGWSDAHNEALKWCIEFIDSKPTIEPERKISTANGCPFLTCKHGGFGDDACSKCTWAYRDMYEADEEGAQE